MHEKMIILYVFCIELALNIALWTRKGSLIATTVVLVVLVLVVTVSKNA